MSDRLLCQSCSQQKEKLYVKSSKLITNVKITICKSCDEKEYEPRYLVTIALHQFGLRAVKHHIERKLYHGDEITLAESMKL
jgi:hypothetical protein